MITIASIEDRIKSYEGAVANALANFHGLTGALNELKTLLTIATPVVDALDPAAAPALAIANEVVNDVSNVALPADNLSATGATGAAQ